jgi:hypothetical protein
MVFLQVVLSRKPWRYCCNKALSAVGEGEPAKLKHPGCVTHRSRRVTTGHSHSGCTVFCCQWSTPSDHGTTRTVARPALPE